MSVPSASARTSTSAERLTLDALLGQAEARIDRFEPIVAAAALRLGALLIDIREVLDRERDGLVPGSIHIPRSVLEWRLDPSSDWRNPYVGGLDDAIVLMCNHGYSSILAAATLADLGFTRVGDVIGGFEAWRMDGLPTVDLQTSTLAPGELRGTRAPERGSSGTSIGARARLSGSSGSQG